jgi:hypothetical protein
VKVHLSAAGKSAAVGTRAVPHRCLVYRADEGLRGHTRVPGCRGCRDSMWMVQAVAPGMHGVRVNR